jgi:hypothetical protein
LKAFSLIIIGIFGILGTASTVHAAEKLRFDAPIPRSSFERIKQFASTNLQHSVESYEIARADLNDDGLYEFVLKPKHCEDVCLFNIVAEARKEIVRLADIRGANLVLGNETSHGVRNILVFESPTNDFDYTLYTWHPMSSSYRKSGQ